MGPVSSMAYGRTYRLTIKTLIRRYPTGFGLGVKSIWKRSSLSAKSSVRSAIRRSHQRRRKDLLDMGHIVLMPVAAVAQPVVRLSKNICSFGGSQF